MDDMLIKVIDDINNKKERGMYMKKFNKVLTTGLVVAASILGFTQPVWAEGQFKGESVKVGVVSDNEVAVWEYVGEKAKEEGIDLEVVQFTDYIQPNEALANGSLDLNAFQHVAFLKEWNDANGGGLTDLGFTYVSPLGAYSEKVESLDKLEKGSTIAIPNDPTNGGRALLLLQQAGVIKVDEAVGVLATVDDITENPLDLKFEELDAAQVAISLADVDVAIINTNYAIDNGLTLEDAIFLDAEKPEQLKDEYKNIVAVREEDKDNELYKHILSLYQTKEVEEKIIEASSKADVAAWTSK